jgi:hypothetical protein
LRLTASDVTRLPFSCALFDRQGRLVSASPEWQGRSFGGLVFEAAIGGLVVEPDGASFEVDELVVDLVGEVVAASRHLGRRDRLSVEMLAAGLALVGGRLIPATSSGKASDVLEYVEEGVRRSAVSVELDLMMDVEVEVRAPAAIALAVVQLVRNAMSHSRAERVTVRVSRGPTFRVEWADDAEGRRISTARRPDQRPRWGLGFARLLADSLGGVMTAPMPIGPGVVGTSIGLGSPRLSIPIACAAGGRVERASRPWDEETQLTPGSILNPQLVRAVEMATASPGQIAYWDIYRARSVGQRTWLGIAPQSSLGRARDVLRGLQHEASLLAAPEPHATRVFALASILDYAVSGQAPEPVSLATWQRDFGLATQALGIESLPRLPADRLRYPDPRVTAFLLGALGGVIAESGNPGPGPQDPQLRLVPANRDHLLARLLCDEDGSIPLAT